MADPFCNLAAWTNPVIDYNGARIPEQLTKPALSGDPGVQNSSMRTAFSARNAAKMRRNAR